MTTEQYEARQEALQSPTRAPLVVAFAGYSGVGKNTAADALLKAEPDDVGNRVFVSVAVADAIKDALLAVDPWITWNDPATLDECEGNLSLVAAEMGWDDAHRLPEVRGQLEALGAWGRNIDPHFWAKIAARRVASAVSAGYSVVVTDVRHLNELDILLELDIDFEYQAFLIERPDVGPVSDDERAATVWFETEVSDGGGYPGLLDHVLVNDRTPRALQRKVLAALVGVL